MLIFAGAAAEFALSTSVGWLFWTNALPNAPIERFFATVRFAQAIVFGEAQAAAQAIASVNQAHRVVERGRGMAIPQSSYRHVLGLLIDYGERAHTIVYGPLSPAERLCLFEASIAIGRELQIEGLPGSYTEYVAQRQGQLREEIAYSPFTDQLYARYREHLGTWRARALLDLQASIVPPEVARLLGLRRKRRVEAVLRLYRRLRHPRVLRWLYPILLPRRYGASLAALEHPGLTMQQEVT
jgi:uncharacterized protein (DUF2236 family)